MFLQAQRSQVQSGSRDPRSVDVHSLMSRHTCRAAPHRPVTASPYQARINTVSAPWQRQERAGRRAAASQVAAKQVICRPSRPLPPQANVSHPGVAAVTCQTAPLQLPMP